MGAAPQAATQALALQVAQLQQPVADHETAKQALEVELTQLKPLVDTGAEGSSMSGAADSAAPVSSKQGAEASSAAPAVAVMAAAAAAAAPQFIRTQPSGLDTLSLPGTPGESGSGSSGETSRHGMTAPRLFVDSNPGQHSTTGSGSMLLAPRTAGRLNSGAGATACVGSRLARHPTAASAAVRVVVQPDSNSDNGPSTDGSSLAGRSASAGVSYATQQWEQSKQQQARVESLR